MRVIRPSSLAARGRRRTLVLALTMLAVGVLAAQLSLLSPFTAATGALAGAAAIGLGVGSAWLVRVVRPDRARDLSLALADLLAPAFDDAYTLVLAPRLPVRDLARLDGILVGPAGVRVMSVRDWVGRYRVRGRTWEFDARGRRGWIRCRTNPSVEVAGLTDGVARWAAATGLGDLPMRGAVVFPRRHSNVVLEEPEDEVVTSDNAPWWANTIGRVRRLDPAAAARVVEAILDTGEAESRRDDSRAAARAS